MKRIGKIVIAFFYQLRYINKCKLQVLSSTVVNGCSFEGKNIVGRNAYLNHTVLGLATFIGYGCEFKNSTLGRFCSIGNNVKVISATHPTEMVSTHPAFFSSSYPVSFVSSSKFKEHLETASGYECEIGNDVWIGDNVLIRGGLKIGDGAIIGMGSVVLHDIEPYTIVAGIPAKPIRKRFDDQTINKLLTSKWWEKPFAWLAVNADLFDDPEKFNID